MNLIWAEIQPFCFSFIACLMDEKEFNEKSFIPVDEHVKFSEWREKNFNGMGH